MLPQKLLQFLAKYCKSDVEKSGLEFDVFPELMYESRASSPQVSIKTALKFTSREISYRNGQMKKYFEKMVESDDFLDAN